MCIGLGLGLGLGVEPEFSCGDNWTVSPGFNLLDALVARSLLINTNPLRMCLIAWDLEILNALETSWSNLPDSSTITSLMLLMSV